MTQLILYIVKSLLCGALFWLLYKTVAERKCSYGVQRVYLLLSTLFTTLFPLIAIPVFKGSIPEIRLPEIIIRPDGSGGVAESAGNIQSADPGIYLEKIFYVAAVLYAIYLLFQISVLVAMYLTGEKRSIDGVRIVFNNNVKSPFSFLKTIFLNKKLLDDTTETQMLLCHERAHISRRHSGDLLFVSILKIFQWFNPFIFLSGKALASVHEFQADEDVIERGYDVDSYQRFILSIQFGISPLLANRLNNSLTIKRLRKMSILIKKKTSMAGVVLLSLSALALFIGISCVTLEEVKAAVPDKLVAGVFDQQEKKVSTTPASTAKTAPSNVTTTQNKPVQKKVKTTTTTTTVTKKVVVEEVSPTTTKADLIINTQDEEMIPITRGVLKVYGPDDEVPFQIVEVKPTFQGGDENVFTKWVFEQLKYPADAVKGKVQGRVILQFVVDENGNVGNVKVVRGVAPSLDQEALRVVAMSPKWTPGTQRGKNVKVRYIFPVIFQLR
ncbi:NB Family Protein [Bacteroidales bacterium CF]|jgi:TonB family C-terminal domain|nr:NB Family Protein [Bacteroidales bacterium CF]